MPLNKQTPAEQQLAAEFDTQIEQQRETLHDSPVFKAVIAHESANTPDDQTLFGVHGVRVTLGDLKQLVNLLR